MLPGIFTSNSGINGERVDTFASRIYREGYAGTAPLLALSSGTPRQQLTSKIVHWFEEEQYSGHVNIVNNAATGTTIQVSGGTVLPKSILFVESTGEQMFVIGASGDTLTVKRGFAGTATATIDGSSNPVGAFVVGSAFEEASSAPRPMQIVGSPQMNYSQIFRNSFANSRSAEKVKWHTGDKVAKNRQDAIANHAADIERAMLWGHRAMFTVDGQQDSTMGGLVSMIKSNVSTISDGALDYKTLLDFIGTVYERNIDGMPQERTALAGNNVVNVINELAMAKSDVRLMVGATEYGIKINKILSPMGDLTILTHPMFNASPVWRNNLLVFHPGALVTHYMDDGLVVDSTPAGMDGKQYTITSELTMEYHCEKTAGILTNIKTAKTN